MKKILSLFLTLALVAGAVCACNKNVGSGSSGSTTATTRPTTQSYTGTVPPGVEISESLYPGSIAFRADTDSAEENAVKIERFKSTQINLVIGDTYMDTGGTIYTVTAVGVATGHPVYSGSGNLLLTLKVLGGKTSRIGSASFQGAPTLCNVWLGNGVESIGDYAFYLCGKLAVVTLPSTLTEIGDAAFGETAIEEIIIPESVTSIGNLAFANCKSLRKVTMPAAFNNEQTLAAIFADYSAIEFTFTGESTKND